MFSTARKHLNPVSALALAALVFAMSGGAYAMSGGGSHAAGTTAAKSKAKVKASRGPRGPAGPAGKTGATGPAGPIGPAGPAGAKGENGAAGANGTGTPGEPGKTGETGGQGIQGIQGIQGNSVTNKPLAAKNGSGNCEEGGAEFKVGSGSPSYACNGRTGFTKTLPAGETETGTWSFTYQAAAAGEEAKPASISFSIPLAPEVVGEPKAVKAEYVSTATAHCSGSFEEPTAESGYLCVYQGALVNVTGGKLKIFDTEGFGVAATFGAILYVEKTVAAGETYGFGSWAVTAPTS